MFEDCFCYWLMGILELGNPEYFNENQTELIKEHLILVKNEDRRPYFLNWLEGFLDTKKDLSHLDIKKIKEKLQNEFILYIDKKYPEHFQAELTDLHFRA